MYIKKKKKKNLQAYGSNLGHLWLTTSLNIWPNYYMATHCLRVRTVRPGFIVLPRERDSIHIAASMVILASGYLPAQPGWPPKVLDILMHFSSFTYTQPL